MLALLARLRSLCCDQRLLPPDLLEALSSGEDVVTPLQVLELATKELGIEKVKEILDKLKETATDECCVCLELGSNVVTRCRHAFHKRCIEKVIETNPVCPLCRETVKTEELLQPVDDDDEEPAEGGSSSFGGSGAVAGSGGGGGVGFGGEGEKIQALVKRVSTMGSTDKLVVFSSFTRFLDLARTAVNAVLVDKAAAASSKACTSFQTSGGGGGGSAAAAAAAAAAAGIATPASKAKDVNAAAAAVAAAEGEETDGDANVNTGVSDDSATEDEDSWEVDAILDTKVVKRVRQWQVSWLPLNGEVFEPTWETKSCFVGEDGACTAQFVAFEAKRNGGEAAAGATTHAKKRAGAANGKGRAKRRATEKRTSEQADEVEKDRDGPRSKRARKVAKRSDFDYSVDDDAAAADSDYSADGVDGDGDASTDDQFSSGDDGNDVSDLDTDDDDVGASKGKKKANGKGKGEGKRKGWKNPIASDATDLDWLSRHVCRLDGRMRANQRESALDRFRDDPDCRVIFCSLKACGVGINLVSANKLILLDPWYVLHLYAPWFIKAARCSETGEPCTHPHARPPKPTHSHAHAHTTSRASLRFGWKASLVSLYADMCAQYNTSAGGHAYLYA